jgi:3-oxoadipate enol-lactonase
LLADAGSCAPLAEALAPTHRVMLADLPGFGGSAKAGPALADVADALAPALAAAGSPAAIIANGYGSFVALTIALRHPHLVSRLVLAGTGAAFSEPGRAAFRGMAAAAGAKGLAAIADTAMRRLFAPDFQAQHPALLAERRERFLATDLAVFTGACLELAALDIRAEIATLTIPTLIIVGVGDEATPPPMARELAGLMPNARLIELPGCAHVPQLQDTKRFVAALAGFV